MIWISEKQRLYLLILTKFYGVGTIVIYNEKIQDNFLKAFDKTESGLKGNWFEKPTSKAGIFEFKERDHGKFYRIFALWDPPVPNSRSR